MKTTKIHLSKAIALLGACLPCASFGAAPVSIPGDLFMGFRATNNLLPGSTQSLLVNLGPASALRDATSPVVLNLGNIGADLTALYGDWRNRTDVLWGVGGAPSTSAAVNGDPLPTLYASKAQSSPGIPGTGWSVAGSSTRATVATTMLDLADNFDNPIYHTTTTEYSTKAVLQGNADTFAWRQFMAPDGAAAYTLGAKDFGAFGDIEALPTATLSLFRVISSAAGSYEGYFSIDAAGTVTFTPATASLTFATWSTTNAGGQAQDLDFDLDGVPNGVEFFMGENGSTFTSNPPIIANQIVWPRGTGRTVTSFGVEISTTLQTWGPAPDGSVNIATGSVTYTVPAGLPKHFVRLKVTP